AARLTSTLSSDEASSPKSRATKEEIASIADAAIAPPPPTPAQPAQQQPSTGGRIGPAVAPADPAPQSESESDPFSKNGSVKFKRGATDIQFGRKHKIIRPRLGLAAQTDMLNMHLPITLVLALTLDD